jgi:23S rRNA (guanosine2251-2'-O)-methyltransferase
VAAPRNPAAPRQLRGKPLTDFLKRIRRPDVDLVFVLQDMQDPVNVGSAFRIADACGVRRMLLTGITTCPPHPLIKKVGRGRERRVSWEYVEDAATGVDALRAEGYRATAVEITAAAVPYDEANYGSRVALVVGHEDHGVTNRTLAACDQMVFLPMHGKGASLNVHVSLGIVAYHVLSRAGMQPPAVLPPR